MVLQGVDTPILRGGPPAQRRKVAITSATLPTKVDQSVCSSITDGNWILHSRGPDWPAELYRLQNDPAQKRNRHNRKNEAVAKRLHQAHLEILGNAHTPEESSAPA